MRIDPHNPHLDAVAGGNHFLAVGIQNVLVVHDAVHLDAHIHEDGVARNGDDLARYLLPGLKTGGRSFLRGKKGGEIFLVFFDGLLGLHFLGHDNSLKDWSQTQGEHNILLRGRKQWNQPPSSRRKGNVQFLYAARFLDRRKSAGQTGRRPPWHTPQGEDALPGSPAARGQPPDGTGREGPVAILRRCRGAPGQATRAGCRASLRPVKSHHMP